MGAEGGVGGQGVADTAVGPGDRPLGQGGQVGPEQLVQLVPEHPQGGRVDEVDLPAQVQAADALAGGVQDHLVVAAEVLVGDLRLVEQLPPVELLDRPLDDGREQLQQRPVPHQVVEGAGPELLGGPPLVAVLGQDDVRDGLLPLVEGAEELLAGHVRQVEADEEQVGRLGRQAVEGGGPGLGEGGAEPFPPQVLADQVGEPVVVVHDQDRAGGGVHGRRLRRTYGGNDRS